MKTLACIDGDVLLYRATSATQQEVEGDDGEVTLQGNLDDAYQYFIDLVEQFQAEIMADESRIAFTGSANFRKDLLPSYKANRKNIRKPLGFAKLRHRLISSDPTRYFQIPGLEGDDVLGLMATRKVKDEVRILISVDKDFYGVPCSYFRMGLNEGIRRISVEQANDFHLFQTLTGDKTDGYSGCPGVGPVKARRILDNAKDDPWGAIVAAYKEAGLNEEYALVQARVARILRWGEYDWETGKPRLWTPTRP